MTVTFETVMNIAVLSLNVIAAMCIIVPAATAVFRTKGKLPELLSAAVNAVGNAEQSDLTGEEKRELVKSELFLWCAENGVPFSENSLNRLIELIVSTANLVRRFLIKR
ncbi:MAG: hypothetical protein J5940_01190 [Clostridia bacterium]|nr:hypothetical protein [Clostridia bacterium]